MERFGMDGSFTAKPNTAVKTRRILILLSFLVLPLPAVAEIMTPLVPKAGKPLKLACVGDSITQGSGAGNGMSYPSQLKGLLGPEWEVGNFGVSGRTLLQKGDFPYWKEGAFQKAKDFNPDAVIIMLGTNDTKPQNWKFKDEFEGDYRELVKTFQGLKSSPRVYICRPVPVPAPGNFGINEEALQQQMPVLAKLTTELKAGTIDMYAALEGKPQLLPDRVHPNTEGAGEMAKAAFQVLTGKDPAKITRVNSLFRDNAVLQRGVEMPVWGTAETGTKVTVQFAGQSATSTAADGKWVVKLKPLQVNAKGAEMKITGSSTITVSNLLVGDVWLASGQSNMERTLAPRDKQRGIIGWEEALASADLPLIRLYTVPKKFSGDATEDSNSKWEICSKEKAGAFSGVAFFFARDLQPAIKVPLGVIHSSWGGTRVEAWTSPGALKAQGVEVVKPKDQNTTSVLYNGMITPLLPFPIKGVIWYQGESNNGAARDYRNRFPAMIADWREKWKMPKLPFIFVQIAPNDRMTPELREAQLLTATKVADTAMAVTTDVGEAGDIHPINKEPVGKRLALGARAVAYGEKIEYSGPVYQEMKVSGDKVALAFTHVGGGLMAKDGSLKGFTIAGEDGNFVPGEAEIRGNSVVVSSKDVPQPKAVRYGWANVPDVNLYNKEGLPASPFRTDVN